MQEFRKKKKEVLLSKLGREIYIGDPIVRLQDIARKQDQKIKDLESELAKFKVEVKANSNGN